MSGLDFLDFNNDFNSDFNGFNVFLSGVLAFLGSFFLTLLSAAIILVITWFVVKYTLKFLDKVFVKAGVDPTAVGFLKSIAKVIIYIIGILLALGRFVEITPMIAALGAAGLTVSFALQGSLSNFISGVQLIFAKPFKAGDFLSIGSFTGTVKKITVLNTIMLTADNKEVIMPNSKITTDAVVNYSSQTARRVDLSYGVSYDADLDFAKKIVMEVVNSCECTLKDPTPLVAIGQLQDSSVEIVAHVWVSPDKYWDTYFYMQEQVKKAFDKNNIVIPFPQLDVHNAK